MEMDFKKIIKLELARRKNMQRKKAHMLQQLFWECTLKCNLSCQHCGSDCKYNAKQKDMPLEDFLPVLDDVANKYNPHNILVITTGGEPLVRPDIIECGREISERGFMWGMVSNGMLLTSEKLDSLMEAGLLTIAISLDGFREDHNWMRGNQQSFDRAVRAIRLLVKRRITWDVITCVNRRNFNTLEEFKKFLLSIGVRHWRIFTVFPNGRAKGNSELQLSTKEMRSLMDFIVDTRKEGKIRLNYSCEGFLGNYEYEVRSYPFFCQAGINVASVLSDGSISGCLSIRSNYNQGNIYKDKLTDVWENRFQPYRDHTWMHTGECTNCKAWRYCEGNGMHLRDEDGSLLTCNLHRIYG